jgi:hypothetical protein
MLHLNVIAALLLAAAAPAPSAASAPAVAQERVPGSPAPRMGRPASPAECDRYANREAAAPELEHFKGGDGGLVALVIVLAAVLILIAILVPW